MKNEYEEFVEKTKKSIDKLEDKIEDMSEDFSEEANDFWKDLKKYFEKVKGLKPYEIKREKEKLMREFQSKILNIKEKDLQDLEIGEIPHSDIFGLYYISDIEGIYSKESGFRLKEERVEDDPFN